MHVDSKVYIDPHDGQSSQWAITRDSAELIIKDLATFRIRGGRDIEIHPASPVDEKMVRLVIINSILGILLFQRKMLVMHASCIELDGFAIAFMGHSGAGKSLMAGTLCSRRYGLITDDISATNMKNESPHVLPGYPMIKMVPQDSATLGFADSQSIFLHGRHYKYGCRVTDSFTTKTSPLRYIFILRIGEQRSIEELSTRESFMYLIKNSAPQIWQIAPDELHFSHLEKLLEKIVVYKFTREKNVAALPEHAEMIEKYCLDHK